MPDLWDTWSNAEIYREYVEQFPIYRSLNRRLVDLARLSTAHRVLDLGCGTGATTRACLECLPPDAEVHGVDSAEAMIETARATIQDPRASFLRADATAVDKTVHGSFDRAVCNAAFWMFPNPALVMRALSRLLIPGGLFVFNAPCELFTHESVEPEPFQISLAEAVSEHTGIRPVSSPVLDVERIERTLRSHGFVCHGPELFRYRGRQGELMELMKVPALAAQLAPHLDYDTCLDIVERAAGRNDPGMEVEVPWVFFVAVRNAS